jgi:hypothetical protein
MKMKTFKNRHFCEARKALATTVVIISLMVATPRKAISEEFTDAKFMYYQEDNNRIRVLAPSVVKQFETESGWVIKVDGIYNAISGATPTGAPPVRRRAAPLQAAPSSSTPASSVVTVAPVSSSPVTQAEHEEEEENDSLFSTLFKGFSSPKSKFSASTGATPVVGGGATTPAAAPSTTATSPASVPSSSSGSASSSSSSGTPATSQPASVPGSSSDIPLADFSDTRWAFNLGLSKRVGQHTPGTLLSFSQESDYQSMGISLQDAIDFNRKTTTLLVGGALTHDALSPANGRENSTKDTVDALLGITQVLTPTTLLTANIAVGQVTGFISDPYKVVELNGNLTYEKRPDSKTKQIVYLAINQFITPLDAGIELGLRHYGDSFGLSAETLSLAWYQKLGNHFILSPSLRYYTQTAADFYDVRFTGSPEFYSSDYRVSAFTGTSFGLKLTWLPTSRFALDAGVERYQQKGDDGITDPALYTGATVVIIGAHWAL